jgi:uncharacterized membrane protein
MTNVSALIATAVLLLDLPAVVVRSVVIAPLIGPAMAASVGTVLDEEPLFVRGMRPQALGLVLAVGSAALFGLLLRFSPLIPPGTDVLAIPQVRERLAPDVLSLAVALGAGRRGRLPDLRGRLVRRERRRHGFDHGRSSLRPGPVTVRDRLEVGELRGGATLPARTPRELPAF